MAPLAVRISAEKLEAVLNAGKLSWNTTQGIPQNMHRHSRFVMAVFFKAWDKYKLCNGFECHSVKYISHE